MLNLIDLKMERLFFFAQGSNYLSETGNLIFLSSFGSLTLNCLIIQLLRHNAELLNQLTDFVLILEYSVVMNFSCSFLHF
jgi:hypothetical protein